ncbi:MAG TPA: DUF1707 domain-containing protein [Actinomycetes bacterium]|nr:DUF1707 domain-containing protein [Actinomycetes bacterium]
MDRDPGDQRRASLRASDADREQLVEALRQHHADGRLTLEELTERTERAYQARTLGDLDALATDLPPARPPAPAGVAPPAPARAPIPGREAAKAAFQRQALMFGLIALILVAIWALTSFGGYFWPAWPIFGLAVALGWQAYNLYSPGADDDRDHPRRS